jgi:DNA-binding protein
MSKENNIYIGRKPPMAYVLAVLTAFNQMGAESINLKARGKTISTAVDVAEICRNRYMKEIQPVSIDIDTEELPSYDGGTRGVSSITITMKRLGNIQVDDAEVKHPQKEGGEVPSSPHEDISKIKGIGESREKKLIDAGFKTVESIAALKPEELAEQSGLSTNIADKLIKSAKNLQKQVSSL